MHVDNWAGETAIVNVDRKIDGDMIDMNMNIEVEVDGCIYK